MNPNAPPDWLPAFLVIFFPIFWCLILYLISFIGGWRQLAKRYRCSGPISGTVWRFQSGSMHRFTESSYGGCLKVIANEEGMGLATFFPFRVGHPSLFIPWSEMLVSEMRRFIFFKRVRFTFPDAPSLWFEISPRLAAKIQNAVGLGWLADPGE
ncbi:MAG TPA: hypothetical protein VHY91_08600 [Pirellulales bacterium]|jgi:hypothetical protein|nr:hypothetical protein [Pirellulales bacterium]